MRRVLPFFTLLLFLAVGAKAQNYKVLSMEHMPNDMTARDEMKTDDNEKKCAVIKIVTQNITPEARSGFYFQSDWGSQVVHRDVKGGVIRVWVSPGLKTLIIMHEDLGTWELKLPDYGLTVEPLHTYKVVVQGTMVVGSSDVKPATTQQYLAFQITPPNATLEVDGKLWNLDSEGNAQKYVYFGTYTYTVQMPDYHSVTDKVTVNDPDNTQVVPVTLRPNFGWIEVKGTGNLQGANVYIDNALVGKAPMKSEALKSGVHQVRIAKEMYETYSVEVTVRDDETNTLTPALKADFAEITLKVDADAEIWVNGDKKGVRTWKGSLGSGNYKIECKQVGHEPGVTTVEITPSMSGKTITLQSPTPIFGSLLVESTPSFCKLYIDGKEIGNTPKSINEILVGRHDIKLTKDGYADHTETVTITKGERKQVIAMLKKQEQKQEQKQERKQETVSQPTVATSAYLAVQSFAQLPMDMTASSLEGKRIDQNGQAAALIKIVTSETGFVFMGGALGIVDTEQQKGEIWVWVPRGLPKITLIHPKYGALRDYPFPVEIESGRCYEMVLITPK